MAADRKVMASKLIAIDPIATNDATVVTIRDIPFDRKSLEFILAGDMGFLSFPAFFSVHINSSAFLKFGSSLQFLFA